MLWLRTALSGGTVSTLAGRMVADPSPESAPAPPRQKRWSALRAVPTVARRKP